jgi:hypothetical protein
MLPYYTQGTIDQMNNSLSVVNSVGCDSDPNANTCQYTWYTTPGVSNVGPSSTNPCPARNSWYDFGKQTCVDGLGNEVLIMNPCASNTVYSLRDNACVSVRKPFASQPPNTVGSPSLSSPGDFGNCKTSDGGDCIPYFNNNGTMTQTNPCGTSSNYSFPARGCIAKPSLSPCCGVPASNLVSMPDCSNLVSIKIANTKSSTKCGPSATNICCGAAQANNATCINGGYWIRGSNAAYNPSYTTLCGIAGFDDYTNNLDTMAAVV